MAEEGNGTERSLLPTLEALIGLQKRLLTSISTFTDRFDRLDTEVVKLNRQGSKTQSDMTSLRSDMTSLRSEMTGLRSDVAARFDAVGTRFDELEHRADQNAAELRETRSEIIAQQNEMLNALQAGLSNMAEVNDLKERFEELERRIGR